MDVSSAGEFAHRYRLAGAAAAESAAVSLATVRLREHELAHPRRVCHSADNRAHRDGARQLDLHFVNRIDGEGETALLTRCSGIKSRSEAIPRMRAPPSPSLDTNSAIRKSTSSSVQSSGSFSTAIHSYEMPGLHLSDVFL
jgi:hypothetical protein